MSPKAVSQRIGRAASLLERGTGGVFTKLGLSAYEFYVLGVLRRSGPPFRMTPTELARTLILTSGSVTNRIDRLEQAGLVVRKPDPADRRGVLVELTPEGRKVIDGAIEAHVATERRLLDPLTTREHETLARLLRKLLVSLGDEAPSGASKPRPRASA